MTCPEWCWNQKPGCDDHSGDFGSTAWPAIRPTGWIEYDGRDLTVTPYPAWSEREVERYGPLIATWVDGGRSGHDVTFHLTADEAEALAHQYIRAAAAIRGDTDSNAESPAKAEPSDLGC